MCARFIARATVGLAAALLTLLVAPAVGVEANRFGPPWVGVVRVDGAVTRALPAPAAAPIGPLPRGALVPVLAEVDASDGTGLWYRTSVGFLPEEALVEHREPWVAAVRRSADVHRSPDAASPVVARAEAGRYVRVAGLSPDLGGGGGAWWATTEGYLPFDAIHAVRAEPPAAWTLPDPSEALRGWWGEIVTASNVRLGPGTSFPRVGLLPAGARVKVLAEEQGEQVDGQRAWYRIDGGRYAGAYVHGPLVRRIAAPRPNASPPPTRPPDGTWIVVDRRDRTLTLVRNGQPAFVTYISTGDALDQTPRGEYTTFGKYRHDDMTSASLPDADHAYDLPNVPDTQYFRAGGYAIHGAYWHDAFGQPHSEGCVNLTLTDGAYLFGETRPALAAGDDARWVEPAAATPVLVVD